MSCNEKKPTANEQEIYAALKLIELLYIKGEIPQHVYQNIRADYYGKGNGITSTSCFQLGNHRQDAV